MINDKLSLDHPPRGIKMERSLDGDTIIRIWLLSTATIKLLFSALFGNALLALVVWKLSNAPNFSGTSTGSDPMLWLMQIIIIVPIAGGAFTLLLALYKIFGRCVVRLGAGEGSIFSGIGPIGRTHRFSLQSVRTLGVRKSPSKYWVKARGHRSEPIIWHFRLIIELDTGHEIKSSDLGEMRATWLALALGKILNRPTKEIKDRVWES